MTQYAKVQKRKRKYNIRECINIYLPLRFEWTFIVLAVNYVSTTDSGGASVQCAPAYMDMIFHCQLGALRNMDRTSTLIGIHPTVYAAMKRFTGT